MATNPHIGMTADEWFEEEEQRSPGFIEEVDQEALKLGIGYELKKVRVAEGLTRKQLAEKISTTPSRIARVEQGKTRPDVAMLQRIGTALGYAVHVAFARRKRAKAGASGLLRARSRGGRRG
jgi:ribosome-binding protein aMBF1 (putative translation factor)